MKYKAIICDFDGTLVGSELVISPQVKDVIRSLTKDGYTFSIASGRLFNGIVQNTCKELNLTAPQITKGGAEIVDPVSCEVIDGEYIPDNFAKEVISYIQSINAFFFVEKGDIAYTINGKPIAVTTPIQFKKIDELVIHNVPKIAVRSFGNDKDKEEIGNKLQKKFPTLHIVATYTLSEEEKYWDITAASANKHTAVLKVAKLLNITTHEIIGIGDGYNDFSLLEACGYKVAMGNAAEELKQIADYIAPRVEEDGVADVIKKFILT